MVRQQAYYSAYEPVPTMGSTDCIRDGKVHTQAGGGAVHNTDNHRDNLLVHNNWGMPPGKPLAVRELQPDDRIQPVDMIQPIDTTRLVDRIQPVDKILPVDRRLHADRA